MEKKLYKNQRLPKFLRYGAAFIAVLFAGVFTANAQMSGSNYTIDKGSAASATNFQSFDAAMDALRGVTRSDGGPSLGGGVNGPVTITVAANSGPYVEEFQIYAISGVSATNTITIDGNGETLERTGSFSSRHVVWFRGGDRFILKDMHIRTRSSSYGWGIRFSGNSDNNIVEDCNIDIRSVSTSSSQYSAGITFTNSTTSAWGSSARPCGYNGRNNIIRNNEIQGSTTNSGMYVGIAFAGNRCNTLYPSHGNIFDGNHIHNYYYYGIYNYYGGGNEMHRNTIVRGQKSSYTTHYGIYNYYVNRAEITQNYIADAAPGNSSFTNYGIYSAYYTSSTSRYFNVENNVINLQNGGVIRAIYMLQYWHDGVDINHNTIYIRGHHSNFRYAYGMYMRGFAYRDLNTQNNIVDIDFTGPNGTTYNYYLYNYQLGTIDNNVGSRVNSSSHRWGYIYSIASGGNNYTTFTDWQNGPNGPDPNGADIRPGYLGTDPSNGVLSPTTVALDGFGRNAGVAEDINGDTRSANTPDPGAYEFDIPVNVSAITFPVNVCQGDENDVEVTITNNAAFAVSDFKVEYSVNNVVVATEDFTGSIASGQSANYTFNTTIVSNNTGNFEIKANVFSKAPVANLNYVVNPSPVGSEVVQGAVFEGGYFSGDAQDPDIVAYGDNIVYDITPPSSYSNGDYGSTWTFEHWTMTTPNGTPVGASGTNTNPGANNANTSFTPVIGQSDSTYVLSYSIRSLTNGCIAPTIERTVFVAPRPVADWTAITACDGDAVQFDNGSSISSGSVEYMWRFGDGDSTVLINPDHVYPSHGTYNVELVVISNYGYEDVSQGTVTVVENPTAEFSSTNVCEGAVTPFQDASVIPAGTPTYTWDFGDGSNMGSGNAPSHQYTTPGVYEVNMTVTANGCSGMATNFVTYAPRATVDFVDNGVTCNNEQVSFTNQSMLSSGTMGYSWDFDNDGNVDATSTNPVHNFSGFGTMDVKLTVTTDFGCVNDITKQITLAEGPQASFTNTTLCNADNVDFTNTTVEPGSATTGYEWMFSDGSSFTSKDVSKTFNNIGMYTVTLTATSTNGCQDMETVMISIDEDPTAQFYTEDVCEGDDVNLNNATIGNNGNVNYSWDLDNDGTVDETDMDVETNLGVGSHDVTLIATTPSGCEDQITKTVVVHPNPTVSIDVESGQTGEGTISYTVTGTDGADYIIFFGDGGRDEGTLGSAPYSNIYTYVFDGTYDVQVRLEKEGCSVEESASFDVYRTSVLNVTDGELKAYPNPTSGKFNLDLSGLTYDNVNVAIYSSNGQLVATADKSAFVGSNAQLDLTTAPAGVYLVKVTTDQGVYNARITLNK